MQIPNDIILNHATLAFVFSLTILISASLHKIVPQKINTHTQEKLKNGLQKIIFLGEGGIDMIGITCPSDRANSHGWPLLLLLAFSAQARLPRYQSHIETEIRKNAFKSKHKRYRFQFGFGSFHVFR